MVSLRIFCWAKATARIPRGRFAKMYPVSGKHNDLEVVGHDTDHHTFLRCWATVLRDYYKKEAIAWAWELLTGVWNLPKDRLYATVFRDDSEAAGFGKRKPISIPNGFCVSMKKISGRWVIPGPASLFGSPYRFSVLNIVINRAQTYLSGKMESVAVLIELWNLVFIQFNRDESGKIESAAG